MGVSFKVARNGTRYRPKPGVDESNNLEGDNGGLDATDLQQRSHQDDLSVRGDKVDDQVKARVELVSEDSEVSFCINLFPNGFFVGETTELLISLPKQLHPYDRASETLFTAIEYGWLPADIFDSLSCKYVNGTVICEIRDYRNSFCKTTGVVDSPIIHKASLQMGMENVIKDIMSISNDCWTYKDLLEVESHIVKALQPVLHLNPKPSTEIFGRGSLTKKLDLGISWSWKSRRVADATTCNPRFSDQCRKGVPNLHKGSVIPGSMSQPNLLTKGPSYQLAERSTQPVSADLRLPHLPSVPNHASEYNHGSTEPSALVLPQQGTCEIQVNKSPILKMPKEEPMDFSQQQGAVSQSDKACAVNLQISTLFQKPVNNRHERFDQVSSVFHTYGQQTSNKRLQGGKLASVKQEPVQTSDRLSLNVKGFKDGCFSKDVRSDHINLQQVHLQRSSQTSGTSTLPTSSCLDQLGCNNNVRKQVSGQKRKAPQNPKVTASMNIPVTSSCQNECLPSKVSAPSKRKKSSDLKVSSNPSCDSRAASNGNTSSSFRLHKSNLPHNSEVRADPILERFLKIKAITQRYGLSKRKCKSDKILSDKFDFSNTTRLQYHLLNLVEDWKSKEAITIERIPLSECFVDRKLNESKTRTLIYVHQSHFNQGLQIPMVNGKAVRLVMSENLMEGFVEASILYGNKHVMDASTLPIFSSTHSADCFAAQYTSLIAREGYILFHERIESTSFSSDGCSSTQLVSTGGEAPIGAGAINLPSSQAPALPKMQHGMATQVSPNQKLQQCLDKQACLQFQMAHTQRQNHQIIEKVTMEGAVGAAAGGYDGIHSYGSTSHGSVINHTSTGGPVQVSRGGQSSWFHNASQSNSSCSTIPSLSGSKQSFSGIADNTIQALATRTANNCGRASIGGYQFRSNGNMVPFPTPSIQDMAYLLNNRPIFHQNQQIQRMRPMIQPRVSDNLPTDLIGSTTSLLSLNSLPHSDQFNSKQFNIEGAMNQLQASSRSSVPQGNKMHVAFSPGSPQESSRTRGSVTSSNLSSSSSLSSFSKKKGVSRPEKEGRKGSS